MGTYTELVLKCRITEHKSDLVEEILRFLFAKGDEPSELPNHDFFKKTSWEAIGRSGSYYHIPSTQNYYDGHCLFSRSDLKNYDDEIESFIDWLMPYIINAPGQCIGWIFYEQSKEPYLIYNKGEYEIVEKCKFCNPDHFVVYGKCKKCGKEERPALFDLPIPIGFCTDKGSKILNEMLNKNQREFNERNK